MVYERWKHSKTSVYNVAYHIIWCPKYRRKVLDGKIKDRLYELLNEKAEELDINIEKAEILPDHIHLFIKARPTLAPHFIIQQLKGYTSRHLRNEFVELRKRLPTLWTRSYYVETIGHISEETIKKYIEDQKNK
ncbi:MAG: IS200/IS605 family transposase [Thermoplasmata archaeon]|nr:MAG: IS200/IS605 family transposase [Thermoplasmata archaeon]